MHKGFFFFLVIFSYCFVSFSLIRAHYGCTHSRQLFLELMVVKIQSVSQMKFCFPLSHFSGEEFLLMCVVVVVVCSAFFFFFRPCLFFFSTHTFVRQTEPLASGRRKEFTPRNKEKKRKKKPTYLSCSAALQYFFCLFVFWLWNGGEKRENEMDVKLQFVFYSSASIH